MGLVAHAGRFHPPPDLLPSVRLGVLTDALRRRSGARLAADLER
jgi:hypothetical protein